MKQTTRKTGLLSLTLALSAGCTTMTEAQRETREYSLSDFRSKFIEERMRCQASGGRLYVQGWGGSLDRDDIPRTRVSYICS